MTEMAGVERPQETVLAEADRIVNGQRREDYGGPFESFSDIAKGWSMVLGVEVTPEQVSLCMIQLKVARAKNGGFHRDSFVDIAGYAQCSEFIAQAREAEAELSETQARLSRWQHGVDGRVCEPVDSGAGTIWRVVKRAYDALPEDGDPPVWCERSNGDSDLRVVPAAETCWACAQSGVGACDDAPHGAGR